MENSSKFREEIFCLALSCVHHHSRRVGFCLLSLRLLRDHHTTKKLAKKTLSQMFLHPSHVRSRNRTIIRTISPVHPPAYTHRAFARPWCLPRMRSNPRTSEEPAQCSRLKSFHVFLSASYSLQTRLLL